MLFLSPWSDLNGQTFISVLAVTKQHLLHITCCLGCTTEAAGKCLSSMAFCISTEKLCLKHNLSRCIFPPPDWVLSPAQSPSYPTPEKWRLGARKYGWAGPWKTHAQTHLYSAVKISERFQPERSHYWKLQRNKMNIIVPYVGQCSKVQNVIPSGRQDKACLCHRVHECAYVWEWSYQTGSSVMMTSNRLWSCPP